jgi:hypothetical protein
MAVYPDNIKMYAELESVWTDITTDVLGEDKITGFWGMRSNKESDRVADVGRMSFTLDNSAGLYAPNLGTALSGWGKGTPIKLVVTFRGREYIKFYGRVDSLKITGGALGLRRVYVTVKDWMDFAAKYPLVNPGYQTDKRADEALTTIVAGMPIQPQDTTFGTGTETFPTIFDAVTTKTRASSEFNKLALSEMGYIYVRKDFSSGENLVFEPRTQRKGTASPTEYLVPAADSGFLLKEDGDDLLLETGDKIIVEAADTLALTIDNNMQDVGADYGNNLINRMSIVAHPRRVDTSNAVLFSLGYPMQIGSGQEIEFRAGYFDPAGGAIVNAVSGTMVAPVATTDYLMNTQSDGSGSNATSDLTVEADYGAEGVTYTLYNANSETCYITFLQARGRGVYTYAALESTVENQESIDDFGYFSDTLNQMYQQNTQLGKNEAARIVGSERLPRTILNTVELMGNKSIDFLHGFLFYDVGDLVPVAEDTSGIDSNYYIQAVHFSVVPALDDSGVIDYGWTLKEHVSATSGAGGGLSFVAAEFESDYSPTTAVNGLSFGVLDYINSLYSKSFSFWVYLTTTDSGYAFILNSGSGASRVTLLLGTGTSSFIEWSRSWNFTSGITINSWFHVVVTKESTVVETLPVFYVNGVSKSVTATGGSAQTSIKDQTGSVFRIGSRIDDAPGTTGKIKDFRIYSSILSAADALAIYNEGPEGTGYLDNLMFQGPTVKTSELSYFTDHTMLSTDRVIDNVYQATGEPYLTGAGDYPIIRLP